MPKIRQTQNLKIGSKKLWKFVEFGIRFNRTNKCCPIANKFVYIVTDS